MDSFDRTEMCVCVCVPTCRADQCHIGGLTVGIESCVVRFSFSLFLFIPFLIASIWTFILVFFPKYEETVPFSVSLPLFIFYKFSLMKWICFLFCYIRRCPAMPSPINFPHAFWLCRTCLSHRIYIKWKITTTTPPSPSVYDQASHTRYYHPSNLSRI